jgi:hypothetical protein
MCIQVWIGFHRLDNVVRMCVAVVIQVSVLLVLPSRPARNLLYSRFSEVTRDSLIAPRAADMGPQNRRQ